MDNKVEATVRSEAKTRCTPPPAELPDELKELLDDTKPTNLTERMENWGSD
jgi:antitoxin component of MazEF toxin-antitoxin module